MATSLGNDGVYRSRFHNPFIKDRKKAGIFAAYPSDSACRIVWTKGNASSVPPEGRHRCDRWMYDTVVFVWMDPRELSIDLSGERFIAAKSLPLSIGLRLIARPRSDDASLRAIAIHFDEKVDVLSTCITAFLHKRCKTLNAEDVRQSEEDLTTGLKEYLEREKERLELPFLVLEAMVQIECDSFESVSVERAERDILHVLRIEDEDRKSDIALTQARHYLALLKEQSEQFAIEQQRDIARADTKNTIEKGKLEVVRLLAGMSPEMLIVAMAANPEIAGRLASLEETRITSNALAKQHAFTELLELLKAAGEASRDFRSAGGVNVVTQK